jgi:hypothetical protein
MSTSTADAVAQLRAITDKHRLPEYRRCLFAFDKVRTLRQDQLCSCVILELCEIQIGKVSCVTLDPSSIDTSQYKCVGIAIVDVNGKEIFPHELNMWKASPLITDLRKAWKEGKFAPVIMPSSR